jgi:hypothetical protein
LPFVCHSDVEANLNLKPVASLLNEEEIKEGVFLNMMEISEEGASTLKNAWEKDISMGVYTVLILCLHGCSCPGRRKL